MTIKTTTGMTRRGLLGAFAATAVAAAPTYSNAAGFLRGGGDVRRLRMYSGRTGERMDTIYWIDGKYIGEAIREVNMFMRDWRTGEAIQMDTRTIDIMAEILPCWWCRALPWIKLCPYGLRPCSQLERLKKQSAPRGVFLWTFFILDLEIGAP